MDTIHDLGGKQGYGAVEVNVPDQAFPERWQGSVFTMVNSLMGSDIVHNTDQFRHAIERIDPAGYLGDGYYGRWLGALENLAVEAGMLDQAQINERAAQLGVAEPSRSAARPSPSPDVFPPVDTNEPPPPTAQRQSKVGAKFSVGDRVRAQRHGTQGHTRLPAYARGALGQIVACHDVWVYPDTNAHGRGEQPEHLYTVAFAGRELWGETCDDGLEVNLDLFESYLLEDVS